MRDESICIHVRCKTTIDSYNFSPSICKMPDLPSIGGSDKQNTNEQTRWPMHLLCNALGRL